MLIDTHAHLYWDSYKEDLDEVIQRSLSAGVSIIINSGVDVEKSKEALRQIRQDLSKYPNLSFYATIGIHPHEAVKYTSLEAIQKDIAELEQLYLSNKTKVAGIGECGLDYLFYTSDLHPDQNLTPRQTKSLQIQLFQAQIDLAKKLNLPLVVHCRDDRSQNPEASEAWDTVLKMVGTHPTVLHCYSGLSHTTDYILQTTHLTVSFAANITYPKNEYLREAAKILPLDRVILETDSPFLSPQGKRGQRNEPAFVKEIAETIAGIKGVSLEKIARQTTINAKQIFAF